MAAIFPGEVDHKQSECLLALLLLFFLFFFCNAVEILVQVGWEEDVGDVEREKSCLRRRLAQP